ncbi:hypothetical protein GGTG_07310 [Gaeumannomyces tritici R3-111a-1]|uniref:NACHT domain-containing protein n=1 Tax=Gaeumannomyces tritici (strain R3-111a-1) TaxID=644352 RepID=J3P1B3_GAET3|nr:hypothetical protein GGTG_07310 [Gaeumannomyces tritici R3-111a-1]EJT77398.1 hypothetical protein GGTG_07310 [Gaeumannomyces tritici R3-111a-1]
MYMHADILALGRIVYKLQKAAERYIKAPEQIAAQRQDVEFFKRQLGPYVEESSSLPAESKELARACLEVVDEIKEHLDSIESRGPGLIGLLRQHYRRAQFDPAGLKTPWKRAERRLSWLQEEVRQSQEIRKQIAEIWPGPHYAPSTGLDGTFGHILGSAAVEKWRREQGQVLLLYGEQGAGKTTLMAKLAKHLEAHAQDRDIAIVSLFFRAGEKQDLGSLDDIMRAILCLLSSRSPSIFIKPSADLVPRTLAGLKGPRLFDAVSSATERFKKVYLLFDGIDEFGTGFADVRSLLAWSIKLPQRLPSVNLVLASLDQPEIMQTMGAWPSLEIQASQADMDTYIQDRASDLSSDILTEGLNIQKVAETVWKVSGRNFLIAKFLFHILRSMDSIYEFADVLKGISSGRLSGLRDLDGALRRAFGCLLSKLESRDPLETGRAIKAMLWILLAQRPLDRDELCHALELMGGRRGTLSIDKLVRDARGFLIERRDIHIPEQRAVQISHRSIRAFLNLEWENKFPGAQADITKALIKCLKLGEEGTGAYSYAAKNWATHFAMAAADESLFMDVMSFLRHRPNVCKAWKHFGSPSWPPFRGEYKRLTGLHLAAYFGLRHHLEALAKEESVNTQDDHGATPLLWAAVGGQEEALMWLLEYGGAKPDIHDALQRKLLHHATTRRWGRALRLLLEKGAPAAMVDCGNMTLLHHAVYDGWMLGIDLFLEAGHAIDAPVRLREGYYLDQTQGCAWDLQRELCDSDSKGGSTGLTPLHYAAFTGRADMVEFLLERGANPAARTECGETALHLAISQEVIRPGMEQTAISQASIRPRIERRQRRNILFPEVKECAKIYRYMCITNEDWKTLETHMRDLVEKPDDYENGVWDEKMQWMKEERYRLVEMLVCHAKTDVNAADIDGWQPLHALLHDGGDCERVARMLLDHGADVSGRNHDGQTPLLMACLRGSAELARLLLDRGADVTETDAQGRNVLHYGAYRLAQGILEICESQSSGLFQRRDKRGRNMLHHMCTSSRWLSMLPRMCAGGAGINDTDDNGLTPLMVFCAENSLPFFTSCSVDDLTVFRKNGADMLLRDHVNRTAVFYYAGTSHANVEGLELFRDAGAQLDMVDCKGWTLLHFIADSGYLTQAVLDFLLGEGVGLSLDTPDKSGMTPLDIAVKWRDTIRRGDYWGLFQGGRWELVVEMMERWNGLHGIGRD